MRAPVVAQKHYVQVSLQTVLVGANTVLAIIQGVAQQNVNAATEVTEGSVVKAVYVEMWARTGDTAAGSVLMSLFKAQEDGTMTFAEQIALNNYNNKKNVLYHTQGNSNSQSSVATPFIRGWFKIPKGKQRFGLGDKLSLSVAAQALDQIICGFMTYKSYS